MNLKANTKSARLESLITRGARGIYWRWQQLQSGQKHALLRMKKIWLTLTIATITVSCANYDSENYLNEEQRAIQDLIPEMMGYKSILNDSVTEIPTLYLNAELDNELKITSTQYEELSEEDKKPLVILAKKKISKRILPNDIFNDREKPNVKFISEDECQTPQLDKEKMIRCLSISRVLFTSDFKKGYLTYKTQCNKICGSNSILSIKKINGHWAIDEFWEWPTVKLM